MARRPVPRAPAGGDWSAFNPDDAGHRAALAQADADSLWTAGFRVLALAVDQLTEFRHGPGVTAAEVEQAAQLRERLTTGR